jgi:hypothetical protein
VAYYHLEAILAVGFRVKSPRGTQFRRWANTQLRELIVKGFVMDDERLKSPGGWDYFDELLARIREIRASEKALLPEGARPLKGNLALLRRGAEQAPLRRHLPDRRRAHRRPRRSEPAQHGAYHLERLPRPQAGHPHRQELPHSADEVDTLNRLVVIFLEQAELRAKQQKDLTLEFWRSSVDRMLASNDQPLLDGPGAVSHEDMKAIAIERYDSFDAKRRQQEAIAADAEDLKAIEDLEKDLKRKGGRRER